MSQFVSSVRFVAKVGQRDAVMQSLGDFGLPEGALEHFAVATGERSFCTVVRWRSEADLAAARPEMIAFLDTVRDKLEVLSDDLGVTDPVSGPVVLDVRA